MLPGRAVRIPLLGFGGLCAYSCSLFRIRTPASKDDKLERSVCKRVRGCQAGACQSPQHQLVSRMLTPVPLGRFHHPYRRLSRAEFDSPDQVPSTGWTTPFERDLPISPFIHEEK